MVLNWGIRVYLDLQCYNDSHLDLQGLFATGFLRNVAREEAEAAAGKKTKSRIGFKMWLHTCIATVGKTIWDRYGGPCTDDDAIVYYEAALPYLIELAVIADDTPNVRSITWASRNAPVMILGDDGLADDTDRAWFAEQEAAAVADRFGQLQCRGRVHLPDGAELGKNLAIRAVEMRATGMRGVSPIDRTSEQLADDRRAADLARKQSERTPQESSPTRLKVWDRIGMGQTTYKKLKAAGRLPPWPDIPRGIDPTPYVDAWVNSYYAMHPKAQVVPALAIAA